MLNTTKKIALILLPSDKRKAIFLVFLMLIGMVLETLSVVMVIPTIAFLVNQGKNQTWIIDKIKYIFPNYPEEQYITLIIIFLVGVYFIKAIFLGFLAWRQMIFSYGIQQSISQRLFTNYLRQPYSFHLKKNSSELLQNVIGEVNLFVGNVIVPGIELITEIFVLSGIAGLLLIYEPLGSLSALGALSIASITFYRLVRKQTSYFGAVRQFHERLRVQHLQQGLGGVKDVKLLGREDDFLTQYEFHNKMSAKMLRRVKTLNQFPRLWLEFLSICGLGIIMFVISYGRSDKSSIIPAIGLFAAAAFRLIPSFNRILNSLQSYRFGLPVIDTMYNELKLNSQSKPVSSEAHNFSFRREIQISGLSFNYPDTKKNTLDDISFTVKYGQTIGIIGPSGSGKSTLVDVILGLLTPTSGNIEVDSRDIASSMRGWQNLIGYVPQTVFLSDDTLRRNIAFGIRDDEINDEAVRRAVRYAQLEEYVSTLEFGIDAFVGERGVRISGGQRQRIGIARALYHNPSVLVLDEATSSLDNETEKGVMESIIALQGSKTILIVAHRLTTVQHCDKIFRIQQGKLVGAGTPKEIFETKNKI